MTYLHVESKPLLQILLDSCKVNLSCKKAAIEAKPDDLSDLKWKVAYIRELQQLHDHIEGLLRK